MSAWISSTGGLIAAVALIVGCLNVVLSAVQQVLAKLSLNDPSWLQATSAFLLKVAQYLGSNPPTPPSTPSVTAPAASTTSAAKS